MRSRAGRGADDRSDEEYLCRVCLFEDDGDDLIAPCLCRGTQKYIHRQCLDRWRAQERQPEAFTRCPTCKFAYLTQDSTPGDSSAEFRRRVRFIVLASRDITLFLLAIASTVALLSALFYLSDTRSPPATSGLPKYFPLEWPSRARYFAAAATLFFAVVGVAGLVAMCFTGMRSRLGVQDWPILMWGPGPGCFGDLGALSGEAMVGCTFVLAVIGVVFGIFFSLLFIGLIVNKHVRVIWMTQQARRHVVVDLATRPDLAAV